MDEGSEVKDVKRMPTLEEAQRAILAMPVKDENSALTILVSFINIAQRRGCYSIEESAKIFECLKLFQKGSSPP